MRIVEILMNLQMNSIKLIYLHLISSDIYKDWTCSAIMNKMNRKYPPWFVSSASNIKLNELFRIFSLEFIFSHQTW